MLKNHQDAHGHAFMDYLKCKVWHYHVHTDKWTLCKLLQKRGVRSLKLKLYGGYIYVICKK